MRYNPVVVFGPRFGIALLQQTVSANVADFEVFWIWNEYLNIAIKIKFFSFEFGGLL